MHSMVYGTVGRPSVCLSVCLSVRPTIRLQPRHSLSLLLSAERARNVDRQRQAPGGHPQRRRSACSSTALSSRREQCRVYSGRMKRYADLLLLPPLLRHCAGDGRGFLSVIGAFITAAAAAAASVAAAEIELIVPYPVRPSFTRYLVPVMGKTCG